MIEKEIFTDLKLGVHSRPAALVVKKAREYPGTRITFEYNNKICEGNSLIGLLSLGISQGSRFKVRVEGKNEEIVIDEIIRLFSTSAMEA